MKQRKMEEITGNPGFQKILHVHTAALYRYRAASFPPVMDLTWITARKTGEELALFAAGFKCENCGKGKSLTIHHLITWGKIKNFHDERKFLARAFWGNLMVLCTDCHAKEHKLKGKPLTPIKERDIRRIKSEFKTKESNGLGMPRPHHSHRCRGASVGRNPLGRSPGSNAAAHPSADGFLKRILRMPGRKKESGT